jgi:hypothetical protein
MPVIQIDQDAIAHDLDWEGNNAAFTCPLCKKVFIVSAHMHEGERQCPGPGCGKSTGRVLGGKKSGGSASITWEA